MAFTDSKRHAKDMFQVQSGQRLAWFWLLKRKQARGLRIAQV